MYFPTVDVLKWKPPKTLQYGWHPFLFKCNGVSNLASPSVLRVNPFRDTTYLYISWTHDSHWITLNTCIAYLWTFIVLYTSHHSKHDCYTFSHYGYVSYYQWPRATICDQKHWDMIGGVFSLLHMRPMLLFWYEQPNTMKTKNLCRWYKQIHCLHHFLKSTSRVLSTCRVASQRHSGFNERVKSGRLWDANLCLGCYATLLFVVLVCGASSDRYQRRSDIVSAFWKGE